MRPPLFLLAAAIAALATLGAVALAQAPGPAPPAPTTAQPGAAPIPPASAAPPSAPVPALQPGASPTAAPTGAPRVAPSAPGAPLPPPGAPPPGPQPPVYGPAPAGPSPPGYPVPPYYSAPYAYAPPPALPLDAHSHTGFFLRMAVGAGYVADASTLEGPTYQGKVDAAGGAIALEVAIGGALSPGLILAGSYSVQTVGNAKLTNDSRTNAAGAYRPLHDPGLTMLAAMLDVYPNHRGGFHLGGSLGFASLRVRTDGDPLAGDSAQNGFGIAPHVGYEWWVSNYWGLGVLGRFTLARTEGGYADGKEKDTVTGASILFSATYN